MTRTFPAFRKHRLALAAAVAVLLAAALAAGTLFAANERQQPEARPLAQQSVTDAMDPGLAADLSAAEAKPETPSDEPGSGVNQVVPESGGSDALAQWLAEQPETMGFITEEDAVTADPDTMDWLLYQAVYKGVLTQEEADAVQAWYDRRPSTANAPGLLNYQLGYLHQPSDEDSIRELFGDTESR